MQNEKIIDIFLKFHVWDFLSEDPSRETFFVSISFCRKCANDKRGKENLPGVSRRIFK